MKKYSFHIDMIIMFILLLSISIGGNIYQWRVHGDLHTSNMNNKLALTDKHVALIDTEIALAECRNSVSITN